jgi:phospholipase/carboxylesterase
MMTDNVHQDLPVLQIGDSLDNAQRVVLLIHGRGATAESMVGLAEGLPRAGTCFLLPQAAGNRWYPQTAFGPLEPNEPDLSSGLQVIDDLIKETLNAGFSKEQIVLGGFSQGACLAAEYLVRNPDRYGGLFVLSGALIGPPELRRNPSGDLDKTPVFIGGSDVDPWVKEAYFIETERVFSSLNAAVVMEIYPGMGHVINKDELAKVRKLIANV